MGEAARVLLSQISSVATRNTTDRYIETIATVIESLASSADNPDMTERLARALVDHFEAGFAEIWVREESDPTRLQRAAAHVAAGEVPEADADFAAHLSGV